MDRKPESAPESCVAEEMGSGIYRHLERERSRIARELHAGAGQSLAAIRLNLELLDTCVGSIPPMAREAIQRLHRLAESALGEVRAVSHLLHPPDWQLLTTAQAIRRLLSEFGAETCFAETAIEIQELPVEPDHSSKIALYRCAQECISNVIRHSGATRLEISLVADGDAVELTVSDNGKGIHHAALSSGGIGLASVESYASDSGGTCTIKTEITGTIIIVSVPQSSYKR